MTLKSALMPLYRKSPPPVRNAFGSVYGLYLNYWRYGSGSEELVERALERESFSAERWRAYQSEKVATLLTQAAADVPYYREQWRKRRLEGDDSPVDRLENWPILEKAPLRADPRAFVADSSRSKQLFKLQTSGTSGTPLTTWRGRDAMRQWYALVEARWRRWYGVSRFDNWAILGGQEVVPVARDRPPFWLWNSAGKQLYLSSLHVNARTLEAYAAALFEHDIVHVYGYPSSLAELSRLALENGVSLPQVKVVVTNAEPLEPFQSDVIARAFGSEVRTTYGMSEAVVGASECLGGGLHLWPDAGVVEVVADEAPERVADGTAGRLICTGLLNTDMPLIRYDIGDRGAVLGATADPCGCSREMPRIARLEGRSIDNLVTPDGRKVFWVNPVLYGLPIHEGQIVQDAVDAVTVNVVPAAGFDDSTKQVIARRLKERLGDVTVQVVSTDGIPRGPNGKFRSVMNMVQPEGGRRTHEASGMDGRS